MADLTTCDTILGWLKEQAEQKHPISPQLYLDAATKLNILISDENDKLIDMEYRLAQTRSNKMLAGGTAVAAKVSVESHPDFREARKQRAKIEQIKEAIRIGKLIARIKSEEMRNQM